MQNPTATKTQVEADFEYVAALYANIANTDALKSVHGFERSEEYIVNTFFYSIGDDFLYINPFVDVFLNGETLEDDSYINVTLCSASGELISCHHLNLPYDSLEASAAYYEREVSNILALIKRVHG